MVSKSTKDINKSGSKSRLHKKEKDLVFLQLFSFDLRTGVEQAFEDVKIEEDEWSQDDKEKQEKLKKNKIKNPWGELDASKAQYNITFSKPFDKKNGIVKKYKDEWNFLKEQSFAIQKYIPCQDFSPFKIYRVERYRVPTDYDQDPDIKDLDYYLVVDSTFKDTDLNEKNHDINRQIHFLNHFVEE